MGTAAFFTRLVSICGIPPWQFTAADISPHADFGTSTHPQTHASFYSYSRFDKIKRYFTPHLKFHTAPGISDQAVLSCATVEGRILITFDKDFGELVFRLGLNAPSGVILFRIPPDSPWVIAQTAVTVLESRTDWVGHFSVVEKNRVRMIPLMPAS